MAKNRIKRFFRLRQAKFYAFLAIAVLVVILILEITNTTHILHKATTPPIIPVSTPSAASPVASSNQQSSSGQSNSGSKNPTSTTSSTTKVSLPLYSPYGDFVSNHMPGANGTPTGEVSVCSTTPGAKCYIKFTKSDGTTSQLPTQTVGTDGSTQWSWNANILSAGDWSITAVASLNGQTKTTQDPTPLSIKS